MHIIDQSKFPSDNVSSTADMSLVEDLRLAVSKPRFDLVYQPKVCSDTMRPLGAEVLIRWHHPARGLIHPDQWIPLVESHNLMQSLTAWLVKTVVANIKALGSQALPLAINIPPYILDKAFVRYIIHALEIASVASHLLEIEITETSPVNNMADLANSINLLKNHGLKTYLDDFGSGYSTMRYLVDLPAECVKIDKCFIQQAITGGSAYLILKALIELCLEIGLTVVCEGIETSEQLELAKNLGAHAVQGYFISQPLSANDFLLWIEKVPLPLFP